VTVVKVGIKEIEDPGMEVKKAWLPIETQVLTRDIAVALKQPDLKGFIVTSVFPGSTAEKAGLQVGDYITAVDDQKLTASAVENYEELAALIRQYKVGDTANLAVLRAGILVAVPVELVRSPKLSREMKEYRDENFDFSVRDVSFFDRAREQWPADQPGVMVSEVKPGGWASLGEVSVGDLILRVDGTAVVDLQAFETKMKEIAAAKPSTVVLQVQRGIYTLFIELEPKWDGG
jgi:serine protease Do